MSRTIAARYGKAILVCFLPLTGCVSKSGPGLINQPHSTFYHSELLLLQGDPYKRLYIEVDTVEGTLVPNAWLDEIKRILQTYCVKPEGIKVIRDEPTPISELEAYPLTLATAMCMDGPPDDPNKDTAYIHIFCYDYEQGHWDKTRGAHHIGVNVDYRASLLMDVSYAGERSVQYIMLHEVGHLLGLCTNKAHGDGSHCSNHGCLMQDTPTFINMLTYLFGKRLQGELCSDCRKDLTTYQTEDTDRTTSFAGPFLMRHEKEYSLAHLPGMVLFVPKVVLPYFEWKDTLSLLKESFQESFSQGATYANRQTSHFVRGWVLFTPNATNEIPKEYEEQYLFALRKAADTDPSLFVRQMVLGELKRIDKE